jgi:multidrug efflux pump subunit AcrB
VDIIGALNREVQINVNLYRMQAAGISFGDIERAVAYENVNISGGELNIDDVRRTLRVTGEFKSIEAIRNLVISSSSGAQVFLSEIAEVRDGYEEKQDYARLDGKSVITLNVIKRSGENLIEASDKIQVLIEKMQVEKFPDGLNITVTGDQSDSTRVQLNDLINTVILGFIFVVIVLMFFMGTTNAIFVGLSVPLTTLLAFIFMPSLGFSLNVIVMFAFLLGLGIVVDDAIVVIENTHRLFHHHKELGITKAAKMAAGEVFIPVLSGTLTTVAPFFPLLFWPGIVGEFMKYLPITLIITLFASLFVAFVMNPVFAVSFMKEEKKPSELKVSDIFKPLMILGVITAFAYMIWGVGAGNFMVLIVFLYLLNHFVLSHVIYAFQEKLLPRFMAKYRKLIAFVIDGYKPYMFFGGAMILLFISFFAIGVRQPKVEFFPDGQPNFVYIYNQMPIGTDASVTDSVTKIIEKRVLEVIGKKNPYVKSVISNVGIGAGDPQNPDRVVAPHKSKVTVAFVKFEDRLDYSTQEVLEKIRANVGGIPGAEISVEKEQNGPPTGKPISIEIAGEDFTELLKVQNKIKKTIEASGIKGIENLKSDLVLNKPEVIIDIDREKAMREGLSTAQIAMEIRTALYGKEISKYREAKDEYKIMLRLDTANRNQLEEILSMPIAFRDMNMGGIFRQVPLNSVAKVHYASTFSTINRKNQERLVTLSSNVLTGYTANEVVAEIQQILPDIELPAGYSVKMGGEQEDQQETADFLGLALVMSFGLIFIILVTQFNSISKPFIIFFTIVFSVIGVLLGLAITGMKISIVMTGVGIIALAGIVVKNGIIMIEFIDELRDRGYETNRAIIEAAAIRLTPVILTAAAAILGLIPLALGMNLNFATLFTHLDPEFFLGGDSVVFWGPLAWTIIFGLSFSTFLTLLVVPAMYTIVERLRNRFAKKKVEVE